MTIEHRVRFRAKTRWLALPNTRDVDSREPNVTERQSWGKPDLSPCAKLSPTPPFSHTCAAVWRYFKKSVRDKQVPYLEAGVSPVPDSSPPTWATSTLPGSLRPTLPTSPTFKVSFLTLSLVICLCWGRERRRDAPLQHSGVPLNCSLTRSPCPCVLSADRQPALWGCFDPPCVASSRPLRLPASAFWEPGSGLPYLHPAADWLWQRWRGDRRGGQGARDWRGPAVVG